jgi:hypothetical protein
MLMIDVSDIAFVSVIRCWEGIHCLPCFPPTVAFPLQLGSAVGSGTQIVLHYLI